MGGGGTVVGTCTLVVGGGIVVGSFTVVVVGSSNVVGSFTVVVGTVTVVTRGTVTVSPGAVVEVGSDGNPRSARAGAVPNPAATAANATSAHAASPPRAARHRSPLARTSGSFPRRARTETRRPPSRILKRLWASCRYHVGAPACGRAATP